MHLINFILLISIILPNVVDGVIEKWTLGIPGGLDEANRIAQQNGCKNLGLVHGFNDVYLFSKQFGPNGKDYTDQKSSRMFTSEVPEITQVVLNEDDESNADNENSELAYRFKRELEAHPCVEWAYRETPLTRVKRGFITNRQLLAPNTPSTVLTPAGLVPITAVLAGLPQKPTSALALPLMQKQSPTQAQQQPSQTQQQQQQQVSSIPQAHNLALKKDFDRGIYSTFSSSASKSKFNDELWTHQWYLQDNANVAQIQSDVELKVEEVWKMGYTGKGIVVTILDDGLEWNHTDIFPNYDPRASWDMNNNRSDPFPRYDSTDTNSHGTRCAGEVAMVANNRKCGVGVAPNAKIGGIKCLDGTVADRIESMSLLHNIDYIDIYSGSWGPADNGQVVDGPKKTATMALERGTRLGRQGKGALYVWANGNGGSQGDHCNCDGYVTSIYTISIGGVTQKGDLPFYGERCASTLAVTCSSGAVNERKVVTTDLHNKCTIDYTGTSAAAPLAAGVYALVLEANNNLTWRDVQHLTAWTSNPVPLRNNPGWKKNAAGLMFNSRFGYGLLNAKALVEAALNWRLVPKKSICIVSSTTRLPLFLQSRSTVEVVFVSDGCQSQYEQQQLQQQQQQQHFQQNTAFNVFQLNHQQTPTGILPSNQHPTPVIYLEHVQVIVDIEYTSRGSLDIFLISPSGTVSTLLAKRPFDNSRNGFDKWALMSVHFWAESSYGKWRLIVRDKESQNNRGFLRNATLYLHGTTMQPAHMVKQRTYEGDVEVGSFIDPVSEFDEDDIYDLNTFPNELSLVRDDSFQPTFIKSVIAMEQANQQRV